MKLRIAWVECFDCGRHGTDGGCFITERKTLWWWSSFIVTFDRDGSPMASHFPTHADACNAINTAFHAKRPAFRVVEELVR